MFPHRTKVLVISVVFYLSNNDPFNEPAVGPSQVQSDQRSDNAYIEAVNFRQLAIKRWSDSKQFLITNNRSLTNVSYVKDVKQLISLLSKLVEEYSIEYDILFTIYSKVDLDISNAFYDKMNTNCFSLCLTQTDQISDVFNLQWISTNGKVFSMSDNLNNFKNVNSYSIHYNMSPDLRTSGRAQPPGNDSNLLVHFSSFFKFDTINIERLYSHMKKNIGVNYLIISRC